MSDVEVEVGTFEEIVLEVAEACRRGKGTFGLARNSKRHPTPFALVAGHHKVVDIESGYLVSLGLTRDQVERLRDQCNVLLDE